MAGLRVVKSRDEFEGEIFESLAIILYLGDRFGVDKKLWPGVGET